MRVMEIGRRQWKKGSDPHRQARVENVFFRDERSSVTDSVLVIRSRRKQRR
jgi:hypothetical protein